jgi:uncharacterized membrane protein YczE
MGLGTYLFNVTIGVIVALNTPGSSKGIGFIWKDRRETRLHEDQAWSSTL